MTSKSVTVYGPHQRKHLHALVDSAPLGAVFTVQEKGEARTAAQNRLIHKWFTDIANHHSIGQTAAEIKAQCNLAYGLPILKRDDEEWASAFAYIFDSLNYEAKLKAIRVLDVPFTRRMGVRQLSEYMDAMSRDYLEVGVHLTNPEERKWEPAA